MKIEIPFLATLFLASTDLVGRLAVLGVEQALLSTAIEWSMKRVKIGQERLFRKMFNGRLRREDESYDH